METIIYIRATHRRIIRKCAALLALFLLSPDSNGHAARQDSSVETRTTLERTLKEIRASEERSNALEKESSTLARELAPLQEHTIQLTKDIRGAEMELSALEERLVILNTQHAEEKAALAERHRELSTLLSAIIRLGSIPKFALIAMPGDITKTLHTVSALGSASASIQKEALALRTKIEILDTRAQEIETYRKQAIARKERLQRDHTELAKRLQHKRRLQEKLFGRQRKEAEAIARLSRKSSSLKELVSKLETSRAVQQTLPFIHQTPQPKPNSRTPSNLEEENWQIASLDGNAAIHNNSTTLRTFTRAKGKIQLPVVGKVISFYGDKKSTKETNKGIVISTRSRAQVAAPFDGEVVFAGPFLDYGRLVILRHNGGFHTLLAGMESLHCTPGQAVMEGEPIGIMSNNAAHTELYVELRKKNRPINPAGWMIGAKRT